MTGFPHASFWVGPGGLCSPRVQMPRPAELRRNFTACAEAQTVGGPDLPTPPASDFSNFLSQSGSLSDSNLCTLAALGLYLQESKPPYLLVVTSEDTNLNLPFTCPLTLALA